MLRVERILFPTDLSEHAPRAFSYAKTLATCMGASVHAVHIDSEDAAERASPVTPDEMRAHFASDGMSLATNGEVEFVTEHAVNATEGIVQYARDHEIDLMVIGLHGSRRSSQTIRGGLAYDVIRRSPCPVLTVRERIPERGVERILVPVDFSESSRQALAVAREIAALFGSRVDLLHVLSPKWELSGYSFGSGKPRPELAEEWETVLMQFADGVSGTLVPITPHVRVGSSAPAILNAALELRADAVIIATHGTTGLRGTVMGKVAESVINCSQCPVLAVKSFGRSPLQIPLAPARPMHLPPTEPPPEPAFARKPRRMGLLSAATGTGPGPSPPGAT
jgi:nucleotide-binding universal stress UspA family protein